MDEIRAGRGLPKEWKYYIRGKVLAGKPVYRDDITNNTKPHYWKKENVDEDYEFVSFLSAHGYDVAAKTLPNNLKIDKKIIGISL